MDCFDLQALGSDSSNSYNDNNSIENLNENSKSKQDKIEVEVPVIDEVAFRKQVDNALNLRKFLNFIQFYFL